MAERKGPKSRAAATKSTRDQKVAELKTSGDGTHTKLPKDVVTAYIHYLQEKPHEIDILFKELLIGVTNFFRDPDASEAFRPHVEECGLAAMSSLLIDFELFDSRSTL